MLIILVMQSNKFNYDMTSLLLSDNLDSVVLKQNENTIITSNLINPILSSLDKFNQPPISPEVNICYLVGDSPSNEFENMSQKIAFYCENGWRFFQPTNGMMFFVVKTMSFYYFVNNSFVSLNANVKSNFFSVGDYKYSAIRYNHDGFLLCDGSDVLRQAFPSLFNVIGTSFGIGDGRTTFNLPDFRGRVVGAIGWSPGLTNRNLGDRVGAEMHTLNIDEIPAHDHGVIAVAGSLLYNDFRDYPSGRTQLSGRTGFTGGGMPHNNMQPTLFGGNVFIYSGVV